MNRNDSKEGGELFSFSDQETISANKLLERKPDESYILEWSRLLQEQKNEVVRTDEKSVVVFRLGREWLGMATVIFHEVAERRMIHKIPHRGGNILMGMANLRGQLRICVNMHNLLEIEASHQQNQQSSSVIYQRMLAIQSDDEFWIFPVDEVYGIHRYDPNNVENVPVTVSKSTANYITGVVTWNNMNIGILDEELLLYSLKRSLL